VVALPFKSPARSTRNALQGTAPTIQAQANAAICQEELASRLLIAAHRHQQNSIQGHASWVLVVEYAAPSWARPVPPMLNAAQERRVPAAVSSAFFEILGFRCEKLSGIQRTH